MDAYLNGRARALRCALLLALGVLLLDAAPAAAQVPDTTQADTLQVPPRPDTVRTDTVRTDTARTDTTEERPRPLSPGELLPLERPTAGRALGPALPTREPFVDALPLLGALPGSFAYDLGQVGWPHGWSPYALGPQAPRLLLDGRPFDDLLTGRPRYDLLPLDLLRPLRVGSGTWGGPLTTYADLRPLSSGRPLTELRYRRGGGSYQAVTVLHTQRRRLTLLDRPGALEILGVYGGGAADNTYTSSRLTRARSLYALLRYRRPTWSLELSDLHSRRFVGAQGGLQPAGTQPFQAVYFVDGFTVRNRNARRRVLRNDLALTLRTRLVPGLAQPLTASAYWTAQTQRYVPADTSYDARMDRLGLRLAQRARWGPHRLHLEAGAYLDVPETSPALPLDPAEPHSRAQVLVRDSLHLGATALRLEGGAFADADRLHPTAAAALSQHLGPLRAFAEAELSAPAPSTAERHGFGPVLRGLDAAPASRLLRGRAGLALSLGPLDAAVFAFGHRADAPVDLYVADMAGAPDTVAARVAPAPFQQAGLTAEVSFRRNARRGPYLTGHATAHRFLDAAASPLHRRAAAALPDYYGRSRLGARYAVFKGDLDFDLYLQGRFWTQMRGRVLHPATGLLALPAADAPVYGDGAALDVFFEAQVRTARLFLSYENALSGTIVQSGVLVVPVYPLPAQQFRFGVYWPIFD